MCAQTLSRFDVDPSRGFLPAADPLDKLPPQFSEWDSFAALLPKLLMGTDIRKRIAALPPLPDSALKTPAEVERAMAILSYAGHAYAWGEPTPPASFPKNLAVPWHEIAKRLGRPPVLSYASYALHNWRRLEPSRPIELGNIGLLFNFLGGQDEEWFILIHVDIEARAGDAMSALWSAQDSAANGDEPKLQGDLARIVTALEAINRTMSRMPERCDPYIYFHRVRPYIHGWKNHPAVPNGLIYEGVSEFGGRPQQFRGETGSQSSIVPALDAGLTITHQDDPLRPYLLEMKEYMPAPHRAFIDELERRAAVRQFVSASGRSELRDLYNESLRQIEVFRTKHLEYASSYIHLQSQKSATNPSAVGTGGTPFMPYLKKHRDETASQKLT